MPSLCEVRDLGRMSYGEALKVQKELEQDRKRGAIPNQLLIVEHHHVVTMGRNGHAENLLASTELMERAGISFFETDRGGDATYHGPGQIVGYPIFDLREWKRDVGAYVRAVEQALIEAVGEFGIHAGRLEKHTGVWVDGRKVAAIGIHMSRWVTTHGFALNHTTDLSYFRYIVPCGLHLPVTSLAELGVQARREEVVDALIRGLARCFDLEICQPATMMATERLQ
jgi:lipoyl(octanoyl) transferase